MALLPEELRQARTAYAQVEAYDKYKKMFSWPLRIFYFIFFLTTMVDFLLKAERPWFWVVYWLLFLLHWPRYRRLKARYPENLRLLATLSAREDHEVTFPDIDQYRPLLEFWTKRFEKRAILWRLDRFLSRGGDRV